MQSKKCALFKGLTCTENLWIGSFIFLACRYEGSKIWCNPPPQSILHSAPPSYLIYPLFFSPPFASISLLCTLLHWSLYKLILVLFFYPPTPSPVLSPHDSWRITLSVTISHKTWVNIDWKPLRPSTCEWAHTLLCRHTSGRSYFSFPAEWWCLPI